MKTITRHPVHVTTAPAVVLVVDDSATIRELIRTTLQLDGYRIHLAANADEGLTLARKLQPDVILLDFVLPDADGLVLLRELRQWGVRSTVVALTGSSSSEVAYRFLRGGAADFLSKAGLSGADVRAAVRRALAFRSIAVSLRDERGDGGEENAGGPQTLLDDAPQEAEPPGRPLRILVVDDTNVARAAVRSVLAREGWTIDEAPDLRRALVALAATAPDVVLLDYLLPDVDGIEAIALLREAGLVAPVIGLSGHGSEDVAARFLRAGAVDFLPKDDLSVPRLVHAIRRAAALHDADVSSRSRPQA